MDSFRLCVAFGPLAMYLLLLGLINLSRRPFIVTGARDLAALGVGVSGLMIVGPIELLMPQQTMRGLTPYVWLVLVSMYGLSVTLAILLSRPRLTIYNISPTAFRPVLAQAIETLDPEGRWAGSSLVLPRLEIELHVESSSAMRNVSLVANGDNENLAGWRRLEGVLAAYLKPQEVRPNPWGIGLVMASLAMLGKMTWELTQHPNAVTQGFLEMLRL